MRLRQIAEHEENGVKVRIMAPDPRIKTNRDTEPQLASRDDSHRPYQNYRRRELQSGRG